MLGVQMFDRTGGVLNTTARNAAGQSIWIGGDR